MGGVVVLGQSRSDEGVDDRGRAGAAEGVERCVIAGRGALLARLPGLVPASVPDFVLQFPDLVPCTHRETELELFRCRRRTCRHRRTICPDHPVNLPPPGWIVGARREAPTRASSSPMCGLQTIHEAQINRLHVESRGRPHGRSDERKREVVVAGEWGLGARNAHQRTRPTNAETEDPELGAVNFPQDAGESDHRWTNQPRAAWRGLGERLDRLPCARGMRTPFQFAHNCGQGRSGGASALRAMPLSWVIRPPRTVDRQFPPQRGGNGSIVIEGLVDDPDEVGLHRKRGPLLGRQFVVSVAGDGQR